MDNGRKGEGVSKIENVEDMPVYRLFYKLALEVEKQTRHFSPDFRWLRIQALKSSESSCANTSEGFYSQYSTEYLQSLYRVRREVRETVVHICYARDVGQWAGQLAGGLLTSYEDALDQLGRLITSIEVKIRERGKSRPGHPQVSENGGEYSIESDVHVADPSNH
jgi:four helix bundle protein